MIPNKEPIGNPPQGGSSVVPAPPAGLKISVDTTEIDNAIKRAERLVELLERANCLIESLEYKPTT